MKNTMRRALAWLTAVMMIISCMPMTALAELIDVSRSTRPFIALTAVEPDTDVYVTFNFTVDGTVVSSQIVNQTKGESVTRPETPTAPDGKKFVGWYVGDTELTFGTVSGYTATTEVTVNAKFTDVYYVYFLAEDGYVHATMQATADSGWKVSLPTNYEAKDAKVTGWVIKDTTTAFTEDTVVTGDTYVTPVTVPAYWVTFNTAGGSQMISQYVEQGKSINVSSLTPPTRTGYTFAGWQDPSGSTVSGNYTPTASVVLTAQWNPVLVKYTVVYWGENANDENYSMLATETGKTAYTGTELTLDATSGALPSSVSDRTYFTFEKSDTVTVAADGSSVLNVYYTRNAYTITFDLLGYYGSGNRYSKASSSTFSTQPVLTMNGTTYTGTYSFTAKYEQDISALWPTSGDFTTKPVRSGGWGGGTTYSLTGWEKTWVSKRLTLTSDIIAKGNLAAYWATSLTTYTLNYMFETPDGTGTAYTYGGTTRYYKKNEAYSQTADTTSGNWNAKAITGFTSVNVVQSDTTVNLYYSRNSYTLTLNNMGSETSESIMFEADISGKGGTPSTIPDGYTAKDFKGWYEVEPSKVSDSSVPYTFGTMPAKNVVLYAYWAKPKVTVNIKVTVTSEIGFDENETVAQGTSIGETSAYAQANAFAKEHNLTIVKWVDKDDNNIDINEPLYGDMEIKPTFVGQKYTLTYTAGEGTGADVVDANEYGPDASARVANSTFEAPAGKVFAYWQDAAGNVYYPGSYLTLNKDTTLTAVYVDTYAKVSVTYKANGGDGSDYTTESVLNNGKVTVLGNTAAGITPKTGYHFVKWNTQANGNGTSFNPDSEARLNSDGENVLYAIWAANTDVSYTVHYYKQGTTTKVADDKVVTGQTFNTSVTESAATVTGYTVVKPEAQTFTLDAYKKEITFYYTANNYTYYVKYYLDGVEQPTMQATGTAAFGTQVETYTDKHPAGYVLDKTENLPLTIQVDQSKNVINVYYKKNIFTLTVKYIYEDGSEAAPDHTETVTYGAAYSVTSPAIDGYVPSTAVVTGTMPAEDKTVTVTYTKRTDLTYTVHYVWNNTTTQVADDKVVTGQTFADVVKETPITVNGYTPVSEDEKTVEITTGTNEITFYYYKNAAVMALSSKTIYDGTEVKVTEFTCSEDEADFSDVVKVSAARTDAGETDVVPTVAENPVDKTGKYIVTSTREGLITILKRDVTLTSATDSKTYDGTPLTNSNVTVSGDGFADGEGATYDVTGSQTVVGSSDNAFTYTLNANTKADNYTIKTETGKLTVSETQAEVVVTLKGNTNTQVYDGNSYNANGYEVVSISTSLYTAADFTLKTGVSAHAERLHAGTTYMGLTADSFENTNPNFAKVTFVVTDGYVTITKKPVTFTAASESKVYDRQPLTNASYIAGALAKGDTLDDITVSGTITDVGTVPNVIRDAKISNAAGEDVLGDYEITYKNGTLEVTPVTDEVTVTITGNTKAIDYDGDAHEVTDYSVTINNDLYKIADFTFSGEAKATGTNADTYPMGMTEADFANINTNFTNVKFVVNDGALTIGKRSVTLTSADDEKVYDGTALENHTVTVTSGSFAKDEGVDTTVTGSQLNVGDSENAFTYEWHVDTNPNNYNITTVPGTLTVTPVTDKVTVTITEHSGEAKYDGKAHTVTGYDVNISNPLYTTNDFTFSGDATVSGTDAGTYDMSVKAEDFANISKNFTNVEFVVVDGQLVINKREVTLTSGSAEKVYDGTALTKNTVTVSGDGFADGEGATYDVTGSQLNKGESENNFSYTLNDNTKADNYTIKTVPGTLTVTPVTDKVTVTITEHSGTAKYDGEEHTVTGYDVKIDNELYTEKDFTFTGDATVSGTNADTYDMDVKAADFTNLSDNFANVEFVVVDGQLVINKRSVTLTSGSAEKEYDGTALKEESYTVTGDGFVKGEGVYMTYTGSQTNAGESQNTFTFEFDEDTLAANYAVATFWGALKVTKRGAGDTEVIIKANDNLGVVYDGQQHGKNEANPFTATYLAEGHRVDSVNIDFTAAAVGKYVDELVPEQAVIVDAEGKDVTANYEITYKPGTLEIVSPDTVVVTVKGVTNTKTYDGNPTTTVGYTVVSISDELYTEADFTSVDLPMASGTDAGYYPMGLTEANFVNNNPNFNVKFVVAEDGGLTINPKPLTITAGSDKREYNGKPLTKNSETHTELATNQKLDSVTITGEITYVGKVDNVPSDARITDASGNDVTKNYDITYVNGSLEITKNTHELWISVRGGEWTYDGQPHGNDSYLIMYDNVGREAVSGEPTQVPITGDDITITLNTTVTDVADSCENSVSAIVFENQDQYENVHFYSYMLTIKPREATVTANDNTVVYDGKAHGENGFTTSNVVEGQNVTATIDGQQTNVGDYEDELVPHDAVITDGDKDVTANYTLTYVPGDLHITKGNIADYVTLTPHDVTETYDGTTYTAAAAEATDVNGNELKIEYRVSWDDEWITDPTWILARDCEDSVNIEVRVSSEGNYEGYVTGWQHLTINPRTLNLTSGTASKSYDGTPLTDHTVKEEGFVEGDGAVYTYTGSQTLVGSSDNEFTFVWATGTLGSNYSYFQHYGKLTVTDEDVADDLVVTKTHEGDAFSTGDTVTFSITVKNIYADEKTITLTEQEGVTFDNGETTKTLTLAGGATETVTATYTVTSDDVLAGTFTNEVTAAFDTGKSWKATDTVKLAEVDTYLFIKKTSNKTDKVALGETITYTIEVTNKGNVPYYNVKVDDDLVSLHETIAVLAVGETVTFNPTHTVTSDDILTGKVTNAVLGKADPVVDPADPENPKTPESGDVVVDETEDVNAALTVTKTSDKESNVALGETITYTITVKNEGNVPYYNVKVDDDLTGLHETIAELPVGGEKIFTTTYTVTSDDILNGHVLNKVTAKGDDIPDPKDPENPKTPEGGSEVDNDTDDVDVTMTVTKVSDKAGSDVTVGETITYTITVTNNGNVPYYGVELADTMELDRQTAELTILEGEGYTVSGTKALIDELPVGATVTVKATYTVTTDDIKLGHVTNTVKGDADEVEDPKHPETPKTPADTAEVTDETGTINSRLTVTKTSDKTEMVKLGETITYTITVKNDGNTDYTGVKVVDDLAGLTILPGTGYTVNGDTAVIGNLAMGEEVVIKATYTVTSDDILAGKVLNTATGTADEIPNPKDPDHPKTPEGKDETENETENLNTDLEVVKTSDKTGKVALNETITYTITVTNKGNVPYYNVKVDDELTNLHETIDVLDVGEVKIFTTYYTVTSDDILAGSILNVATAKGDDVIDPKDPDHPKTPEGKGEKEDEGDDVSAKLTVTKTSDKDGQKVKLGQTITYTITVKNEGNVPYYNVKVDDNLTNMHETIAELPVGKEQTFTTTYTVTSDDILAGTILNSATAKGDDIPDPKDPENPKTPEGGDETIDEGDDVDTTLTVQKVSDKEGQQVKLGDVITYTITVVNEGNVPYYNVKVDDDLTGLHETIAVLEVDEAVDFTTTHTVTSDDILTGEVLNSVTAKGDDVIDPKDPETPKTPEGEDEVTDETEDVNAALTVTKTSDKEGNVALGETITYTITVKNEGNVPYYNVKVDDDLTGLHETIAELPVGGEKIFTTTYTVTSDDILNGHVLNAVTAKGDDIPDPKDPENPKIPEGGDEVDNETDDIDTTLTVKKTSDTGNVRVREGETITYTITVTNDGNTPYYNVQVDDLLDGVKVLKGTGYKVNGTTAVIDELAVGETVTITAQYTVTDEDIPMAQVTNTVKAEADGIEDPKGGDMLIPAGEAEVTDLLGIDVTVTVRWVDGDGYYRPATPLVLQLIGNNGEVMDEMSVDPRSMKTEGKFTFERMPILDSTGKEIIYTVYEPVAPGNGRYDVTYNGLEVTNTAYVTVTFVNWNGAVLKKERLLIGASTTAPENPIRVGYRFTRWEGGTWTRVTRDQIISAVYQSAYDERVAPSVPAASGTITNVGDCFD